MPDCLFASVKPSFWMHHGATGVCSKLIILPWRGRWLSLWRQDGCHEYMAIGSKRAQFGRHAVQNQHFASSLLTEVFAVRHVDKVGARFGFRVLGPPSGISLPNKSS
jgi:hypothetical protein